MTYGVDAESRRRHHEYSICSDGDLVTVFLGLVAVTLVLGIVATFLVANRDDEVVGFTLPHDLQSAQRAASLAASVGPLGGIAPQPVVQATMDDIIAERAAQSRETVSLANFYPGNLGVGTTLTYGDVDSVIFGVISFDFDGATWQDYLAEHAEGQWWRFGVEPDRGMKLAAFEPRRLDVEPGPDVIMFQGDRYRVTESGQANYRTAGQTHRIGQTAQFATGRYAYFDYENDARVILSYERFDAGPWITSIGHHVDPQTVRVSNH